MRGEGSSAQFRLFVAIPVQDAVRNEMIRVQSELQPLAPVGVVRWAKPEQFHLTLRFLGEVSSDRVTDVQESIRLLCVGAPVLHLRAHGVGFFPNVRSPRVIWVGVADDENRLVNFQKKVEVAVRPLTVEPAGERFFGHVTVGRLKRFNCFKINKLTACAEAIKDRQFGKWTAHEVEVVRSDLSRIGTVYTRLAAFPFERED